MTGMQMMLKAFGINISDADIIAIEQVLPKLPAMLGEAVLTIKKQGDLMMVLEEQQRKILQRLEEQNVNHESGRGTRDGTRSNNTSRGRSNGGNS
jgi:hypothetical protein